MDLFLRLLPLIEKLVVYLVQKIDESEKKRKKDDFKKSVLNAIMTGDQRSLEDSAGAPSDHSGVRVVKKDDDEGDDQ